MAGIKTLVNTQWGRVLTSLSSAVPSADNEGREPSVTPQGALWVRADNNNPAAPPYGLKSIYSSSGLATAGTIFGGTGDLLEFFGFKANTAALRYMQVFSQLAAPVNTDIPLFSIAVPGSNTTFSLSTPLLNAPGYTTTTNLYWALSSTPSTLTLALSGNAWVNAIVGIV